MLIYPIGIDANKKLPARGGNTKDVLKQLTQQERIAVALATRAESFTHRHFPPAVVAAWVAADVSPEPLPVGGLWKALRALARETYIMPTSESAGKSGAA